MKCPYCEKEMILGYIQCRDGVYWTLKKQLVASLSSLGKGSTCLSNGAADNSNTVFAFKCEDCKKITLLTIRVKDNYSAYKSEHMKPPFDDDFAC